jgi:hypothetical protein
MGTHVGYDAAPGQKSSGLLQCSCRAWKRQLAVVTMVQVAKNTNIIGQMRRFYPCSCRFLGFTSCPCHRRQNPRKNASQARRVPGSIPPPAQRTIPRAAGMGFLSWRLLPTLEGDGISSITLLSLPASRHGVPESRDKHPRSTTIPTGFASTTAVPTTLHVRPTPPITGFFTRSLVGVITEQAPTIQKPKRL